MIGGKTRPFIRVTVSIPGDSISVAEHYAIHSNTGVLQKIGQQIFVSHIPHACVPVDTDVGSCERTPKKTRFIQVKRQQIYIEEGVPRLQR